LFVAIPKGFFPTQDVGLIIGISEGAQDSSFQRMVTLQEKLNDIIAHDPAVASFASQVGAGTAGQQGNDGRFYINLKPWDQRPGDGVMQVIARLTQKVQAVPGVATVHATRAGHQCRRPAVAHAVSGTTLQDAGQ